jgi:CBS domain-containing protein
MVVRGGAATHGHVAVQCASREHSIAICTWISALTVASRRDHSCERCASHARMSFALCRVGKLSTWQTRGEKGLSMAESIRDLMTKDPRTVTSGATVMDAARVMRDEDAGIVPVVEGDKLVGTVTDRDIAIRVVAEGKSTESTTVGEIASRELVTIDPQQDLDEALRLMARHQVRRLPVVEEDGRLVGIVAQADIARNASDEQTGDVVEDISK